MAKRENTIMIELEALEFIFNHRDKIPNLQWEPFYEKLRKIVVSELSIDELKQYNPSLCQEIVNQSSISQQLPRTENNPSRRGRMPNPYFPPKRHSRDAKIGDTIIYEGISFSVIGWNGCNMIGRDKYGSTATLPNDKRRYKIA